MDLVPESIRYRYKEVDGQYIVWISEINRFLKLEKPAFQVLMDQMAGAGEDEIIAGCEEAFGLTGVEANRFVKEIAEFLSRLFRENSSTKAPSLPVETVKFDPSPFSIRYVEIYNRSICFCFHGKGYENSIFPLFNHFETLQPELPPDLHLEVGRTGNMVTLVIDQKEALGWSPEDFHHLKGALSMRILNCIYRSDDKDWMGVIHASSVSVGNRSLIFPAQPGSGKSTLAALMMAHGCSLVSDDFTPVSVNNCHIFSYPARISLKKDVPELLLGYFPELREAVSRVTPVKPGQPIFLTPSLTDPPQMEGFPVKAIVFVEHVLNGGSRLYRIPNLESINALFNETWLASNVNSAERFLDWYFQIPCYSLQYSNVGHAVDSLLKLLKHDP